MSVIHFEESPNYYYFSMFLGVLTGFDREQTHSDTRSYEDNFFNFGLRVYTLSLVEVFIFPVFGLTKKILNKK